MGQLQVTQVQRRLEDTLVGKIDASDLTAHSAEVITQAVLSRALAAFMVMKLTHYNADRAAMTITDGSRDNGIDAIAVLPDEARIIVVQSKWSAKGKGSASLEDMVKLREGLNDLVSLRWQSFNEKVTSRKHEIELLLLEPSVLIEIAFAHMGSAMLAIDVRKKIEDYLVDLNDPTETATFNYYSQSDLHRMLIDENQSPGIDLTVELSDWGQIEGPPRAIYGQVLASDVASWYQLHGRALLAKNVRLVLSDSEVNESLFDTLRDHPEVFWYYNNGLTVLCDRIAKAAAGGTDRRVGNFSFEGVSVVNGAQTVGALARAGVHHSQVLNVAKVMVRFISLEAARAGFAAEVTRATNTQNRIGGRDFLSLDPEQARLRDEFAVDQLIYVFRSGETDPPEGLGCSVLEATVALACNQPTSTLSTLAKREVGRLWEDISKPPYRRIFNPSTTYLRVWRSVQVLRRVDHFLSAQERLSEGRARGVAVHGNRLVLHLVFRQLDLARIDDPNFEWDPVLDKASALVAPTLSALVEISESSFPGYPASLFKNAQKCAGLEGMALRRLLGPASP